MSPPETPTSTPTNPPWVRWAVIGLILLVWVMAGVSILLGDDWQDVVIPALGTTLLLSAVDLGIDLSRKKGPKP